MSPLELAVREEIQASGAEAVGVVFLHLGNGAGFEIEADRSFHPASTFKIAVMMEAFRRDMEGTFPLDQPVRVVNEFRSVVDGSAYQLSPADDSDPDLYHLIGEDLPARELMERMITRSGNLATNVLLDLLGPAEVTDFMRRLGIEGLIVRRGVEDKKAYRVGLNNAATAKSLAKALSKLAIHRAISSEVDEAMLDILRRQHFREGIPRFLPEHFRVAHKTGWNEGLYHDAAIVYPMTEEPYLLVVLTQGLSYEKEGPDLVAKISQIVYEATVD